MPSPQVRRILIVEDEGTLSHFLAQSFLKEADDYEVVTVASGEEALEALATREFGVLITDILLPQMSGLDLIERVRAVQPRARIIAITAYGDDELRRRARALGAFDFIDKPFPFHTIRDAVLRAFDAVLRAADAADPGAPDQAPPLRQHADAGGARQP